MKVTWQCIKILFEMVMFMADILSDIILAAYYFSQGDLWWGSLTIAFTIPPMAVSSIYCNSLVIGHSEWSYSVKCFLMPLCTFGFPITPFILFFRSIIAITRGKNPDTNVANAPKVIKHWEAVAEAYPQSFLQLYIYDQFASVGYTPDQLTSQWFSICTSLISLAFFIITNVFQEDAKWRSKFAFFGLSFYTFVSRLMICCFVVPREQMFYFLLAEYFVYFIVSFMKRQCGTWISGDNGISNLLNNFLYALGAPYLSIMLDCTTLESLILSCLNLAYGFTVGLIPTDLSGLSMAYGFSIELISMDTDITTVTDNDTIATSTTNTTTPATTTTSLDLMINGWRVSALTLTIILIIFNILILTKRNWKRAGDDWQRSLENLPSKLFPIRPCQVQED